jgi:hypothetical protein
MWPFNKKKKEIDYSEFIEELHIICKEWLHNQIHDLPEDELPPQEDIDQDILDMRNETFERMRPFIDESESIVQGSPNDKHNLNAFSKLIEEYNGHEQTTPIFTKLALSKVDNPKYQKGWPLFVVKTVADTWLEQSTSA